MVLILNFSCKKNMLYAINCAYGKRKEREQPCCCSNAQIFAITKRCCIIINCYQRYMPFATYERIIIIILLNLFFFSQYGNLTNCPNFFLVFNFRFFLGGWMVVRVCVYVCARDSIVNIRHAAKSYIVPMYYQLCRFNANKNEIERKATIIPEDTTFIL